MRYLSVCSGIEAASVAWRPMGWEPVAFAEVEPFPSAVLMHRLGASRPVYPLDPDEAEKDRDRDERRRWIKAVDGLPDGGEITNYGDFRKIGDELYGTVDIVAGGTPCFPGDTLITTERGFVPIEEVKIGDKVLTHRNRWRTVLNCGSRTSNTIILKGQGQSTGLVTTRTHPVYARNKSWRWVDRKAGYRAELSSPEWRPAEDMKGMFWASPASWPYISVPDITVEGREKIAPEMTPDLAWFTGRWIGDGWTRINDRRGYVLLCCGHHEEDELEERLVRTGLSFSKSMMRTAVRFHIYGRAFAKWLRNNFGAGAGGKTIPPWVMSWNLRKELLDGYLSADGCVTSNGHRINTVSKKLALGTVSLAHSLGYGVSRRLVSCRSNSIEGRKVNVRDYWQITLYNNSRSSFEEKGLRWGKVRKVEEYKEQQQVWNLEIEGDNSYVADGIIVHNCQSYSLAGLRKGLDDPRGKLGIEFVRLCYRTGAPFFLWENVPGVLSSGKGRDFAGILSGWTGRDVTVPRKGWRNSGIIEPSGDDSYGVCWRVLDSQYTRVDGYEKAVPQRRRRVFVVGYRGDWRPPAAVLLEPGGMPGDTAAGPDEGEGVARTLTSSPGGCSGKEQQHTFIGRDGTPLNPICMAHGQSNAEICQNGGGPTLTCNHEAPVICYENHPNDSRITDHGDLSPTLTGRAGTGGGNLPLVARRSSVRRLLPVETERLQGFPDGWTGIPWRNKYKCGQCGKIYTDRRRSWADGDAASCPDCGEKDDLHHHTPDGPRYKAVGNSWAVNCARWIGRRIDKVNKILADQKERDGRR